MRSKNQPWCCHPSDQVDEGCNLWCSTAACDKFKSQLISRIITMSQYLWRFMKILIDLHISAKVCQDPSRSTKICQDLLRSAEIWWNMWRSGGICQNMQWPNISWWFWNHTHLLSCGWCSRKVMVDGNRDVYQSKDSERLNEFISVIYKKSLQDIWKRFVKHLKKIWNIRIW